MEQTLYRIGEASAQLGLQDKNSNTLRSWVDEFKDHLGASANPEPGRPRFFTEDDMRVLRTVRDLRLNHLPYSEIQERLAQGAQAVEPPRPAEEQHGESLVAADLAGGNVLGEQIQALLTPLSQAADHWRDLAEQYHSRLKDREARVVTLEQRLDGLQSRVDEMQGQSAKQREEAMLLARQMIESQNKPSRRKWFGIF